MSLSAFILCVCHGVCAIKALWNGSVLWSEGDNEEEKEEEGEGT